MDLKISVYGNDGAVVDDSSPGNNTGGIFFLGCEVRMRRAPHACPVISLPRLRPAPPPRRRARSMTPCAV